MLLRIEDLQSSQPSAQSWSSLSAEYYNVSVGNISKKKSIILCKAFQGLVSFCKVSGLPPWGSSSPYKRMVCKGRHFWLSPQLSVLLRPCEQNTSSVPATVCLAPGDESWLVQAIHVSPVSFYLNWPKTGHVIKFGQWHLSLPAKGGENLRWTSFWSPLSSSPLSLLSCEAVMFGSAAAILWPCGSKQEDGRAEQ